MSINNVVTLSITRSSVVASRDGFGLPLILGPNADTDAWGSDRVREYTDPDDMLEDGFTTSDAEYKAAVKLMSQEVSPASFLIGRMLTKVAQVDTFTPDVSSQAVQDFDVTINGVEFSFESDITPTAAEVVTGLIALINAGTEPVTASGTTTLILTSDVAGLAFSATGSDNMDRVATTANVGPTTDLADISEVNDEWYWLVYVEHTQTLVEGVAEYIEAQKKIFVTSSADTGILAAGTTTDLASVIKAANYSRTYVMYSAVAATQFPEAGFAGRLCPLDVGSWTAKFKTLAGITVDTLTATQASAAATKRCNIYTTVGGVDITSEGVTGSGEYLDVIVGCDWIESNMQADVFEALAANDKLPYTNPGVSVIESKVANRLRLAVVAQILAADPVPATFAPLVADIDPADRALRRVTGLTFSGTLAGAIHATTIRGNVSF